MSRQSLLVSMDQMTELSSMFDTIDSDGNGYIDVSELGEALATIGIKLPGYEIRNLIKKFDSKITDERLDIDEFKQLYSKLKEEKDFGRSFKSAVSKKSGINNFGGLTENSAEGTTHMVRHEEEVAFTNWINRNLATDDDCKRYLPMDAEAGDLYNRCKDGIIFCKLINKSAPQTIDERTINKISESGKLSLFQINENLTLALNSASSIGCNTVNNGPEDIRDGKPHLVLALLWQIIRIGLFAEINLHEHPGLAVLLEDGEELEDLMNLTPEQLLIRWVNYHLSRSTTHRRVTNFTGDIKDSIAYSHLLAQIAPRELGITPHRAEGESDLIQRAEYMLQEADKMGCRVFVSPDDVVSCNSKLNIAFVANLFNMYPALEPVEDINMEELHEETREEKTYRNWMNSMGVSPYVNYLYNDLTSGLVIFQLYDIIQPGSVEWKKVVQKFNKMRKMLEKIENCNYAIQLGRNCKFSLVGIDGKDIYDGNITLTLALVWQLMKAYTLSMLSKLTSDEGHMVAEREIVAWANDKLSAGSKQSQIRSFQDPSISTSRVVIDLVDCLKPDSIRYDVVNEASTEEEKFDNAKYAISMARKIGARVYALPEDLVEVKSKMVMTIFACLMIKDFQSAQ